jgi:hypothetical protein
MPAGTSCSKFSAGWRHGLGLILHTGLTTRCDLLQRFLRLAANHFPGDARQLAICLALVAAGQRRGAPARLATAARHAAGDTAAAAAGDLASLPGERHC